MCQTCHSMETYQTVASSNQLRQLKEYAYTLVNEGTLTLHKDFTSKEMDFSETQFLCRHCGKVHVLWLHTFLCRTGGECRTLTPS